ncbi:MAG: YitT family protein [Bacteroidales bacterium]|nr:YitT family protein [Bacteroidales bacterium]
MKEYIKEAIFIIIGSLIASVGLKGFLLPNNFFDGGITGVSLFLNYLTKVNVSIFIILLNIPFAILAYKIYSRVFIIKLIFSISLLSLIIYAIKIPVITHDKLLIAIFGGIFLGAGIGFTIRGGSVLDGSEILALYVSRKYNISVGTFIAAFNVILFGIIAIFINIETAMYSILTYFSASKTVDFIILGVEEYIGVMIISNKWQEIRRNIIYKLKTGVTIIKSDPNFPDLKIYNNERNILFCVVTRFELSKLLNEVHEIDSKSFIIQYPIKDVRGGFLKRRSRIKI